MAEQKIKQVQTPTVVERLAADAASITTTAGRVPTS